MMIKLPAGFLSEICFVLPFGEMNQFFPGCDKGIVEKRMRQVRIFFVNEGFAKKERQYEHVVNQQ